MAHQSGIRASHELVGLFQDTAKVKTLRAVKIIIKDEALVYSRTVDSVKNFKDDFSLIKPLLDAKHPCFIYYRLDSELNDRRYQWIVITFVPDEANVRDKMIYASSRQTLVKDLGDSIVGDSMYATHPKELTYEAYVAHVDHQKASAPLTSKERELAQVRKDEVGADIGTLSRRNHVAKLALKFGDNVDSELERFKLGNSINVVVLGINLSTEQVDLNFTQVGGSVDEVRDNLNPSEPQFLLVRYIHKSPANQEVAPTLFIYFCPSKAQIKHKMIYSCTKQVLVHGIEASGIKIDHKFEIDDIKDLTNSFIYRDMYNVTLSDDKKPVSNVSTSKAAHNVEFMRPSKPGKGPAKLIK